MNKTAVTILLAIGLPWVGACSKDTVPDASGKDALPTTDEIKNEGLLNETGEDVRKDGFRKKAADFPDLKVENLKPGEGEDSLEFGESASFHIVGTLSSGKEFKNTRKQGSGELLNMVHGGAVRGLILGCLGMKKGEVRSLLVPAPLGYGEAGDAGLGVPSNASFILHVELLEFGAAPDPDLLIRRIQKGKGPAIRVGQTGMFLYTGILADGAKAGVEFDTNRRGGNPIPVTVGPEGRVIAGWKQGLIGMKVGEQRWLKIPPHLAYGESGTGPIPPDATLIFEVQLVAINP